MRNMHEDEEESENVFVMGWYQHSTDHRTNGIEPKDWVCQMVLNQWTLGQPNRDNQQGHQIPSLAGVLLPHNACMHTCNCAVVG